MIMEFLERDLEDIIIKNRERIHERGLPKLYTNVVRQFYLPDNRIIDLFSWEIVDNVFYCQIFELKRNDISRDAYFQIMNYGVQILRILLQSDFDSFKIDLILVGKSFQNDIFFSCFLTNNLHLYTYNYDYNGITFLKDSFTYSEVLSDESMKKKTKDYSSYYKCFKDGVSY